MGIKVDEPSAPTDSKVAAETVPTSEKKAKKRKQEHESAVTESHQKSPKADKIPKSDKKLKRRKR